MRKAAWLGRLFCRLRRVGKGALRAVPTTSLTKRTRNILHIPTPVRNQFASFDITMKTAVWPIRDSGDVPVLHGIEVNVVDMPFKVRFIAYSVLPIAALPDAFFSLGNLAFRSRLRVETTRKSALDQAPSRREISIPVGKRPDR